MKYLFLALLLIGCTTFESVKDITPERAEQLSYLRSTLSESKQSAGLTRVDQLQMSNTSMVPRSQ